MQRYQILRVWIWEFMLIILASGLIISIAALLEQNHGKPVPDWGNRISFNALLAFLSTILRATLVIIASQIISQRKWEWYKQESPRPLSDLQQFDAGSRGTFGALFLLPTILLKDAVALAAIVVLLASFLIGPFVQQASRTMDCSFALPGPNASLPFAHYIPLRGGYNNEENNPWGTPTQDLMATIFSAAIAVDGVENRISATCTTGNCTFPGEDKRDTQNATHSTVGMCSKCIDISSLVYTTVQDSMYLKGIPEEYGVNGSMNDVITIKGSPGLAWLGDLLTPDLRAISRWAYVNSTILARASDGRNYIAAVCSLYPCLKTYISSIDNNQLSEREVRTDAMRIDIPALDSTEPPLDCEGRNSLDNRWNHYTAVDPLCLSKDRDLTSLPQSDTSQSGVTNLALYDFIDYGEPTPYHYTIQNFTASENCIYRQHALFVQAVSLVLNEDIFNGRGEIYRALEFTSEFSFNNGNPGRLENAAVGGVLRTLYNHGEISFSATARWFDAFANAMTNRYRFQYGAAAFNISNPQIDRGFYDGNITEESSPPDAVKNLAPGEVRGLAWQTTVCVSMQKDWLLLPLCLTITAALLTAWMIGTSWRYRHTRPVWKDSILPLIFYSYMIESVHQEEAKEGRELTSSHQQPPLANGTDDDGVDDNDERIVDHDEDPPEDGNNKLAHGSDGLLEASEMKALGEKIPVTFRWSADTGKGETALEEGVPQELASSTPPLRQRSGWRWRRQRIADVDVDSLLETDG
ncbi:hypothetical protein PG991_008535 [Apiospora marii]|uniref:Uncharacterized protein n=1 Tax=Apiospora marii TaxID=335849 RepID=A0ABR1RL99_9PEZI